MLMPLLSYKRPHIRVFVLFMGLLLLWGCTTPPEPEPYPLAPYDREILIQDGASYTDARIGWRFPIEMPSVNLIATQGWEYSNQIIGIEYRATDVLMDPSMVPLGVPQTASEDGSVTVNTYPEDYQNVYFPDAVPFSDVLDVTGFGFKAADSEEAFWSYQRELENNGYNLWKLVKLVDSQTGAHPFHSLLVLKKQSNQYSDAIVLSLGRVDDVYLLITIRKNVRNREELDQFSVWAYDVLKSLGLQAR